VRLPDGDSGTSLAQSPQFLKQRSPTEGQHSCDQPSFFEEMERLKDYLCSLLEPYLQIPNARAAPYWLYLGLGANMSVEFQFDFPRTLAAITYIASRNIPDLTMYRILKILFLADKHHLVRYGRTLTGDKYSALPDGPVPSRIYDIFKKQILKHPFTPEAKRIAANLAIDKSGKYPQFRANVAYDAEELSKSDIAALDYAIEHFGDLEYDQLKCITHALPAYKKVWAKKPIGKDSVPMHVEDFFEGDPNAVPGAKEAMLEADQLAKCFGRRRTV
jgi:uncharacterized phage-associated protein